VFGDLTQDYLRGTGWYHERVQLYSAALNFKVAGITLTSVTGYGINHYDNSDDGTGYYGYAALGGDGLGPTVPGSFAGYGVAAYWSPGQEEVVAYKFEGDKLTMAATDSYRLSVKETTLGESGPELDAIIPARALQELARLAAGAETVSLGVHENHVLLGVGDVWLTSRRIDGQFPNYNQLLPESFEAEVTTPRAPLLEVVRRASVMAQRNSPLRLRFAEGELSVSAQTQDVGEARESLGIEYAGEPIEIGFNPNFLRDGLEAVAGDTVQLRLINPLRPGLIAAPDESFWYLIMPIRLAG